MLKLVQRDTGEWDILMDRETFERFLREEYDRGNKEAYDCIKEEEYKYLKVKEFPHTCKCGYEIEMDLPKEAFRGGSLIWTCPQCCKKYLLSEDGSCELFKREPIRFLAMHY
jgi:hypothetical protein